jgi:hypothetical protein
MLRIDASGDAAGQGDAGTIVHDEGLRLRLSILHG